MERPWLIPPGSPPGWNWRQSNTGTPQSNTGILQSNTGTTHKHSLIKHGRSRSTAAAHLVEIGAKPFMRAPPHGPPRPYWRHGAPLRSPERNPGGLEASCGTSPAPTCPNPPTDRAVPPHPPTTEYGMGMGYGYVYGGYLLSICIRRRRGETNSGTWPTKPNTIDRTSQSVF
jgi:hypothetical protein